MAALGIFLTRVIALFGGVICLYISMFTKDDDGRVQNWLINLWVKVEDISERRGSGAIGLLSASASKITTVLDKIFGPQLMSLRFAVSSSILSITSLYLLTMVRYALSKDFGGSLKYAAGVGMGLLLVDLLIAKPRKIVMFTAGAFALLYLYWTELGLSVSFYNAIAGITLGIILDWIFVWSSRLILRKLGHQRPFLQTAFLAILITVLGLALLAPSLLFVSYQVWYFPSFNVKGASYFFLYAEWIAAIASATNIAAGLCALSLMMVVIVALFHKLTWPFFSQLINVCYERRIIERRLLFFTAGSTLLTYAFGWFSWLGKLPKFLAF